MKRNRYKPAMRLAMAGFFVAAGMLHFLRTSWYLAIMPPYLPYHRLLVYLSGVSEILGGIGVLIPRIRRLSGYGLIALLVAVFPANIHMAVHRIGIEGLHISPLMLWLRLPFQLVIAVWVWWCTNEPLRGRTAEP